MPPLASDLRKQLENVCIQARDLAEAAARSALQKRAVDAAEPFIHFTAADKQLRTRLRARGRQISDVRHANKSQAIDQLTQELAYEYWHRMLFARFLAENNLLINPEGVAVSLEECEELAKDADPPAPNGFVLAARFASKMLPQIFRTDDVLLQIDFAAEQRLALEKLLASLVSGGRQPAGIPDMSYLRWRDDGTPAAGSFEGWPRRVAELKVLDPCCGSGHFLVAGFNLLVPLRMHEEGLSAKAACDAVLRDNLFALELDPRCTQIAAFALALAAWRYPDRSHHAPRDGSVTRSVTSTVEPLGYRELPPLNIACAGIGPQASEEEWLKLAEQSGRPMNAVSREPILDGLRNLHALFSNAPTLGSLIDPNQLSADLITADYHTLQPYLAAALAADDRSHADRSHHAGRDGTVTRSVTSTMDDDARQRAVAAQGMAKAAELLAGEYTLVVTNVPYLGRGKQDETLKSYLEKHYAEGKSDLATAFVLRCLELGEKGGTAALVTPQNWLFLTTYKKLRETLLKMRTWNAVARLGPGAFETIGGHVVNVALLALSVTNVDEGAPMAGIDVSAASQPAEKARMLRGELPMPSTFVEQAEQLKNPDARITFERSGAYDRLEQYAICRLGLGTGDAPHYLRRFWEIDSIAGYWRRFQTTMENDSGLGGLDSVVAWDAERDRVHGMSASERKQAHNQDYRGREAWGRRGIAVSIMSTLKACMYSGELFDKLVAAIVPLNSEHLSAVNCYLTSEQFVGEVRKLDQKLMVTNATLVKVPFDSAHWQQVAAEKYPNGLPEPESDDPTQWLFHGRPDQSTAPLQVAVGRLLGYRWPAELDGLMRLSQRARELVGRCDELLALADADGLVPISSVRGEPPAAERLLELLQVSHRRHHAPRDEADAHHAERDDYGVLLERALSEAGCKPGTTLDDWLRNQFFEQHCKLFHQRPFIWHLWDGRKDGFSCLVNYHKLNHKTLENLTYSYLGGWIAAQAAEAKADRAGAGLRLAAAQALQDKLKLILAGEPPYDIFVRWKPLSEQAMGWSPDLNDGLRMNIRPFIEADILRKKPNIKWTKDRGKEPERDKAEYPWFWKGNNPVGDRINDVHLTNADKQAARNKSHG